MQGQVATLLRSGGSGGGLGIPEQPSRQGCSSLPGSYGLWASPGKLLCRDASCCSCQGSQALWGTPGKVCRTEMQGEGVQGLEEIPCKCASGMQG